MRAHRCRRRCPRRRMPVASTTAMQPARHGLDGRPRRDGRRPCCGRGQVLARRDEAQRERRPDDARLPRRNGRVPRIHTLRKPFLRRIVVRVAVVTRDSAASADWSGASRFSTSTSAISERCTRNAAIVSRFATERAAVAAACDVPATTQYNSPHEATFHDLAHARRDARGRRVARARGGTWHARRRAAGQRFLRRRQGDQDPGAPRARRCPGLRQVLRLQRRQHRDADLGCEPGDGRRRLRCPARPRRRAICALLAASFAPAARLPSPDRNVARRGRARRPRRISIVSEGTPCRRHLMIAGLALALASPPAIAPGAGHRRLGARHRPRPTRHRRVHAARKPGLTAPSSPCRRPPPRRRRSTRWPWTAA